MKAWQTVVLGVILLAGAGGLGWQVHELSGAVAASGQVRHEERMAALEEVASRLQGLREAQGEAASQAAVLAETARRLGDLAEAIRTPAAPELEPIRGSTEAALSLSQLTSSDIRGQAAAILGHLGTDRAEARLVAMAREDQEMNVRQRALQALRDMESQHLTALLKENLQEGSAREQSTAASFLASYNAVSDELLETMLQVLAHPKGDENTAGNTRQHIVRALRSLGDPRACGPLLGALAEETQHYRRYEIAYAISECADWQHAEFLGKALTLLRGQEGKVSSSAYHRLFNKIGELGDLRSTEAILPYLTSENDQVQRYAFDALEKLRDPLAAEALVAAADAEENGPRSRARSLLAKGYPGVRKGEAGAFELVDEERMKQLLAERKRRLEGLVEARKRAAEVVELF